LGVKLLLGRPVARQGLEGVDHAGAGPPVAVLEHGRVPVVAVRVAALVTLALGVDYGCDGRLGLDWDLEGRVP